MITPDPVGGPGGSPAPPVDEQPEDRMAAAVLAVDGVAGLHGGMFGEAATYLPGRRLRGITSGPGGTAVHVSVLYGYPVREVAHRVRLALAGLAPAPVEVTVEDVVDVPAEPVAPELPA